ncbi:unnamed protein product [Protopolystoma xenopodis]|uniref:Uncharacterized protein n=1 Tax=Protopolystoma xenopodis TaxID=117903 RepID=A0A3S5C971_9PLAT|nr:unnamed protein product [Protopolystoma xenopodis]
MMCLKRQTLDSHDSLPPYPLSRGRRCVPRAGHGVIRLGPAGRCPDDSPVGSQSLPTVLAGRAVGGLTFPHLCSRPPSSLALVLLLSASVDLERVTAERYAHNCKRGLGFCHKPLSSHPNRQLVALYLPGM